MEQVLEYLNNHFYKFAEKGTYKIENNEIQVRGKYVAGQYIRITGSIMNDSVVKVISVNDNLITLESADNSVRIDEEFDGVIYSMAVPLNLINLCEKIKEYNDKDTGLVSESFGDYSYNKGTNKQGEINTWKDRYKTELKAYKRMGYNEKVKFIW